MQRRTIPMSQAVTDKLKKLAAKARGTVQVGFINTDQAQIAYWNEFGHGGRFPAPARPFFRTMVAKDSPSWPNLMASHLKASQMDGEKTLSFMGEHIDGELKQSITEGIYQPLSAVTLRLRLKFGNNPQNIRLRDVYSAIRDVRGGAKTAEGTQAKPLIWTGQMLNSTSYRVSK